VRRTVSQFIDDLRRRIALVEVAVTQLVQPASKQTLARADNRQVPKECQYAQGHESGSVLRTCVSPNHDEADRAIDDGCGHNDRQPRGELVAQGLHDECRAHVDTPSARMMLALMFQQRLVL
jgi:hypothetical protein